MNLGKKFLKYQCFLLILFGISLSICQTFITLFARKREDKKIPLIDNINIFM